MDEIPEEIRKMFPDQPFHKMDIVDDELQILASAPPISNTEKVLYHFPTYGKSEFFWHIHVSHPRDPGIFVIRIPGFGIFPGDSGFCYKLVNYLGNGRWNEEMPKAYFWCPLPR